MIGASAEVRDIYFLSTFSRCSLKNAHIAKESTSVKAAAIVTTKSKIVSFVYSSST
jgi:hypothetical protein